MINSKDNKAIGYKIRFYFQKISTFLLSIRLEYGYL